MSCCKCPETSKRRHDRNYGVIQRNCSHSAFDGYRLRCSSYSTVVCLTCGFTWRTCGAYVPHLPDVHLRDGVWKV